MLKNNKKHTIHLIITIAIMAFIFINSAMRGEISSKESNFFVLIAARWIHVDPWILGFYVRKTAHFTEYMLLGLAMTVTVRDKLISQFLGGESEKTVQPGGTASDLTPRSRKISGKTHSTVALVSWIICTLYAGTDELHQYFVPGRACSLRDVCIDSAGALLGVLIMLYHSRKVL